MNLPLVTSPGLKVGLLGGSFNPAHEGHRLVSLMALRQLQLDQVWWLVSPQNPLKSASDMAPLEARMQGAKQCAAHPRLVVTDIETHLGTRFTVDTVEALKERYREVHFVWLMGADNMIQLPRWAKWRDLVEAIPMAIYPRPGFNLKARLSPAATTYRSNWLDPSDAPMIPRLTAPALCFLEGPQNPISATQLRQES
ncbi:nicotinate-nucleotide adenylyltransferase [Parvibaculaceae bacterium PLY_AMNH_Bact1]|nr:nicotinate-nucleotide adenylyltransferase [Parvibaculaceae bacterium PLY_AMNH_Bact1]